MADVAALAALVVAAVALVVVASQLTQQLMTTAYVIRTCDRIVTGGLLEGGTRKWHWRKFHFTVTYQAISFALPKRLYESLGVSPAVQTDSSSSRELLNGAIQLRPKRTFAQACWISFVQDLAMCTCVRPKDLHVSEESGDRIPDDLTVAPIRVDAITVLLICIAMGMQVYKYSPTTGEIVLAGRVGSISSSSHPLLGTLLHYGVYMNHSAGGSEAIERNVSALRQKNGVWANAILGRFQDRLYRRGYTPLGDLIAQKMGVLRTKGWPQDSHNDTIGGAACFMAFSHVDAFQSVPPSVSRRWCAHFAEVIVSAHCLELAINGIKPFSLSLEMCRVREHFIDLYGCSSPHLLWESCRIGLGSRKEFLAHLESGDVLAFWPPTPSMVDYYPSGFESGTNITFVEGTMNTLNSQRLDPSSYLPTSAAWECIMRADQCMRLLETDGCDVGFHNIVRRNRSTRNLSPVRGRSGIMGRSSQLCEELAADFHRCM